MSGGKGVGSTQSFLVLLIYCQLLYLFTLSCTSGGSFPAPCAFSSVRFTFPVVLGDTFCSDL